MLVGLLSLSLLWAAFDLFRWVLPIAVLAYFWPVLISDADRASLNQQPLLVRYPVETAIILAGLALRYSVTVGHADHRFWGIKTLPTGSRPHHLRVIAFVRIV
jgi:hypothetical protein